MQLGFVGLLEVDQILHLWERLLGFMDPTLLAVTAVAIFMHRAEMLLRVSEVLYPLLSRVILILVFKRSRRDSYSHGGLPSSYPSCDPGVLDARRKKSFLVITRVAVQIY
jgi:hypothetical protein